MKKPSPPNDDNLDAPLSLDWDPTIYQQISNRFQAVNAEAVLAGHCFGGAEHVLDIGCGDGSVSAKVLAPRVPRGSIVGLDKSPAMIQHARSTYARDSAPKIEFVEGDASDLTQGLGADRKFDVVFSNAALHWLIEGQAQSDRLHLLALRGFRSVLTNDGSILLAFTGKGSLSSLVDASLAVARTPKWDSFFADFRFPSLYSEGEYGALLAQAGLQTESIELVSRDMTFESIEKFVLWYWVSMRSFIECLRMTSVETQKEFAREAVLHYLKTEPLDSEECPHVVYKDLVIFAGKKG